MLQRRQSRHILNSIPTVIYDLAITNKGFPTQWVSDSVKKIFIHALMLAGGGVERAFVLKEQFPEAFCVFGLGVFIFKESLKEIHGCMFSQKNTENFNLAKKGMPGV